MNIDCAFAIKYRNNCTVTYYVDMTNVTFILKTCTNTVYQVCPSHKQSYINILEALIEYI